MPNQDLGEMYYGEPLDSYLQRIIDSPLPVVYISGPMRDLPLRNFPAFDKATYSLRKTGKWFVISPAEIDRKLDMPWGQEYPDDSMSLSALDALRLGVMYAKRDVSILFAMGERVIRAAARGQASLETLGDASVSSVVYVLPDASGLSRGRAAEIALARWLSIPVTQPRWGIENA